MTESVADVMHHHPKRVEPTITVGRAHELFADQHVHMLLLVDNGGLIGTLVRDDLISVAAELDSMALPLSTLHGRCVGVDANAGDLLAWMTSNGLRRLAVVDEKFTLVGLLCLKRSGEGFCSDADVQARGSAGERHSPASR